MSAEPPLRWEEELLVASVDRVSWPVTPELRARVLTRIVEVGGAASVGRSTPTPGLPGRLQRRGREGGAGLGVLLRRLALVAVALLLVVVLAVVSVPGTRTAVAEFFGLVEGYRIERVPATVAPTTTGLASITPDPTPTPTLLRDVAQRTTLDEAVRRVGFEPALPAAVAGLEPEVYVLDTGVGTNQVATTILRYPTFDLWQARIAGRAFVGKGVPEGEVIETPSVKGVPGYWISGFPRTERFFDSDGREVPELTRVVTQNALVWSTAGGNYRIETDLPLAEALLIAESLP